MDDNDKRRHDAVYERALEIYRERDEIRDGLWKDYTPRDQIVQAKIKIERVLALLDKKPAGYEAHVRQELPDIINYTIYADRQLNPQDGKV